MPQGGRCARRAASPRTMLRHIRVDGRSCPSGFEYLSREWVEGWIGTSSFVLSCGSALTPKARGAKGVSGRYAMSRKGKERVRTVQAIEDAHARRGLGAAQVATSTVSTPQHLSVSTHKNEDAGCSSRTQVSWASNTAVAVVAAARVHWSRTSPRIAQPIWATTSRGSPDAGALTFERRCATPNLPGA